MPEGCYLEILVVRNVTPTVLSGKYKSIYVIDNPFRLSPATSTIRYNNRIHSQTSEQTVRSRSDARLALNRALGFLTVTSPR